MRRLLLLLPLLLSGCALAPLVVGLVVDASVGTVGIVQRQGHQTELERQTAELKALRVEVKALREQTSKAEIIREGGR
jgi:hypothetical protein